MVHRDGVSGAIQRSGTFGRVTFDALRAFKLFKSNDVSYDFVREVAAHKALDDHPHIAQMIGWCTQPAISIVLHRAEDDLHHYVQRKGNVFSATLRRRLRSQLMSGVAHIHRLGFMHRDIKPANVLVWDDGTRVQLTDMGTCIRCVQGRCNTTCAGTYSYSAPELLETHAYDARVDWFSVGLIFYELWRGDAMPCRTGDAPGDFLAPMVPFAADKSTSETRLITSLLQPNPEERWTTWRRDVATCTTADARRRRWPLPLNEGMRDILFQWLEEVTRAFKLASGTYERACRLVDVVIARSTVKVEELQCLGCAALHLASKLEETTIPEDTDYAYISANSFSASALRDMQIRVLTSTAGALYV